MSGMSSNENNEKLKRLQTLADLPLVVGSKEHDELVLLADALGVKARFSTQVVRRLPVIARKAERRKVVASSVTSFVESAAKD